MVTKRLTSTTVSTTAHVHTFGTISSGCYVVTLPWKTIQIQTLYTYISVQGEYKNMQEVS